jgi:HlyD family secretion protein
MNKPERPEIFARAQGLLKSIAGAGGTALRRVGGAGGTALRQVGGVSGEAMKTVSDAGGAVWNKATYHPDDGKRRRRILVISGAAILAAIVFIFAVSRVGGDENMQLAPAAPGQSVSAVVVTTHTFQPVVALNGEARPVRDIQVTAPATGVRILALMVDEGDTVRQGQPMARLDTNLAQAQTRAAEAQVANAQAAAIRARGEYNRAESIRDS